jgi:hypothetical protein
MSQKKNNAKLRMQALQSDNVVKQMNNIDLQSNLLKGLAGRTPVHNTRPSGFFESIKGFARGKPVDTDATRPTASDRIGSVIKRIKGFALGKPVDTGATSIRQQRQQAVENRLSDALKLTQNVVIHAPKNTLSNLNSAESKLDNVLDGMRDGQDDGRDLSDMLRQLNMNMNMNTNPNHTTPLRLVTKTKNVPTNQLKNSILTAVSGMEKYGKQIYIGRNRDIINTINKNINDLELKGKLTQSESSLFKTWKTNLYDYDLRAETINSEILVDYIKYRYEFLIDIYTYTTEFMRDLIPKNFGEANSFYKTMERKIKIMKKDNDPGEHILHKSDLSKYITNEGISLNIIRQHNMMLEITQTFTKLFTANKTTIDNTAEFILMQNLDNFEDLKKLATEIEYLLSSSHSSMERMLNTFEEKLKHEPLNKPAETSHTFLLSNLVTRVEEFIYIICKFFEFIDNIAYKLFSVGNYAAVFDHINGLKTAISNILGISKNYIDEIKTQYNIQHTTSITDKIDSKFLNHYLSIYPKSQKEIFSLPSPPKGGRRKSPKKPTKLNRGADMNMKDIRGLCKDNQIKLSKTKDGVRVIYTKKELIKKLKRKKIL